MTFLSGGIGGARLAYAFQQWNRRAGLPCAFTAIVNVGDDFTHLGLRVSPDIDSVTYHLADLGDQHRGWGRAGDTDAAIREVQRVLPEAGWFQLGDLDIAHNAMRTHLLTEGLTLSEVTAKLTARYGVDMRVLPSTNDPSPTRVRFSGPNGTSVDRGFQEWWVRDRAEPLPQSFEFPLVASTSPAPGVIEAISGADVVVIAPSNPIVSIEPILAIPGIREAVERVSAPVVGISPIIANKPVRGWADRCLQVEGVDCTASAVAERYGHRNEGGLLDGWLVDEGDVTSSRSFPGRVAASPLRFTRGEEDFQIVDALFELAAKCEMQRSVNSHRSVNSLIPQSERITHSV
ncbi:MAG: 2-phospho-L-lactate transferase [Gulosibacter sp.]|uniref:2-phospho-L-lactate transferase n=1 Tax=Gulosibacter sp. TaxID=2817531 RepID=UPI003F8F4839